MTTGLVFLDLSGDEDRATIEVAARRALSRVSPGRTIAAMWRVPEGWSASSPLEAWLTDALLGPPTKRTEQRDVGVDFFGNLAVRAYRSDDLVPSGIFQVALFRTPGPWARERAKEEGAPIDEALLDTRAYAFTRDYANNVWHLRDRYVVRGVASRVARLVCWPDENVVIVRGARGTLLKSRIAVAGDLVGVPEKYSYEWSPEAGEQLRLLKG